MKSVNSILLAFLVFISTTGLTLKKHYCGDKLYDVSVLVDAGCNCSGEEMTDRCCHNELKTYQLRTDYITETRSMIPQVVPVAALHILSWITRSLDTPFASVDRLLFRPPPNRGGRFSILQHFLL